MNGEAGGGESKTKDRKVNQGGILILKQKKMLKWVEFWGETRRQI